VACTPECGTRECGPDPVCGVECGDGCSGTDECTFTGTCVPEGSCTDTCEDPYGYNCGTWEICSEPTYCGPCVGGNCIAGVCISTGTCGDGIVQQPNSDGFDEECDGLDLDGNDCESVVGQGYSGDLACTSGCLFDTDGCQQDTAIDTGLVGSVWPVGVGLFFDSSDLSVDPLVNYGNNFVRFPGSAEARCLLISNSYPPTNPVVYDRTFIRLDSVTIPHTMQPGESYEIWETEYGCLNF
jgi:hypothetical protein